MVTEVLFPRVERSRREAYLSPPSKAQVKNMWVCTSTPIEVFMVEWLIT
jgi:hypothetical protein